MGIFKNIWAKLNEVALPSPKKDDAIANLIHENIKDTTPIEILDNTSEYDYSLNINGIDILITKDPLYGGGYSYRMKIKKILDVNDYILKKIYGKVEQIYRERLLETLKK